MSLIHNILLRGINAVYNQAINVATKGTTKDKLDFASFAFMWGEVIHEHHETEETELFPEINRMTGVEGLMDGNVQEHTAFHEGLGNFTTYLGKVRKEEEELDGVKLNGIIDSFMPVLRTHLDNEIDTISALGKFEDKIDWMPWFKKKVDEIAGKAMKTSQYRVSPNHFRRVYVTPKLRTDTVIFQNEIFPMVFILHDKTFDGGVWKDFPPVPWIVSLLLRFFFMNTHKDWWRFAGCDFNSQPKELPFA